MTNEISKLNKTEAELRRRGMRMDAGSPGAGEGAATEDAAREIGQMSAEPSVPVDETASGTIAPERGGRDSEVEDSGFGKEAAEDLAAAAAETPAPERSERGDNREESTDVERERAQRAEELRDAWLAAAAREAEADPDVLNPESEIGAAIGGILRENQVYALHPEGFRQVVELARARLALAELPGLKQRLAALDKENERLVRLTSIAGSPPARPAGDRAAGMSERDLRRMAAEYDAGVVF